MTPMHSRVAVLAALLVVAAAFFQRVSEAERIPSAPALATFPANLGEWHGRDAFPFDPRLLEGLGVSEYLNRVYVGADGSSVAFYVGYYGSQRNGQTIHSPTDCMPGSGWEPVERSRLGLPVLDDSGRRRTIVVNEHVVRKGGDGQLVLYWYQSQGRVVAGEYWSRIYMMWDAVRRNRTDAALVRVITPIADGGSDARGPAAARARAFVQAMFPRLSALLPS